MAETLDDILKPVLAEGRFTAWCAEVGVTPWTVLRMRKGMGQRTHATTIAAMAFKLGVEPKRLAKAIAASRRRAK